MCLLAHAAAIQGAAAQAETLQVSFRTSPAGGQYKPQHCDAVWIEDTLGSLVKTLARWGKRRHGCLVSWAAKVGDLSSVDGVTGATVPNHDAVLAATWDMKNGAGTEVPDGVYVVRIETTDRSARRPTHNHQGRFAFRKNGKASSQKLRAKGFPEVVITYSGRQPSAERKPDTTLQAEPEAKPEAVPERIPADRPKPVPMTDERRRRSKMSLALSYEANMVVDKAVTIYREVIEKWPDSKEAAKARARLKEIEEGGKEANG